MGKKQSSCQEDHPNPFPFDRGNQLHKVLGYLGVVKRKTTILSFALALEFGARVYRRFFEMTLGAFREYLQKDVKRFI